MYEHRSVFDFWVLISPFVAFSIANIVIPLVAVVRKFAPLLHTVTPLGLTYSISAERYGSCLREVRGILQSRHLTNADGTSVYSERCMRYARPVSCCM